MRCRRIDSWLLVMALAGCAQERERAPQATGMAGAHATTATTGDGSGSGGTAGGTAGSGGAGGAPGGSAGTGGSSGATPRDAAIDSLPSDGAPDTPLVVIRGDAPTGGAACPNGFTTVGSNRLRAGGATPAPFAAAYNADLDASNTAGPMLLALYRVGPTKPFEWMASMGGLHALASGGVGFLTPHSDLPFTLAADRSLHIAPAPVDFALNLITPAAPALIPIGSFALEGALSINCGSVTVERATLLVPQSAGPRAFHGSTVAELMGVPTEMLGGVPNSAWRLDLAGTAAQVYAPGLLGDGGIEP